MRDIIALCWYVPWLQGGCQDRLAGSASIGLYKFLKLIFGIRLYMFRTVPLSIIRSFSLYTQHTCMT